MGGNNVTIPFVFAEHILPTNVRKVAFVANIGSLSIPG
jgi:hypothetical protein